MYSSLNDRTLRLPNRNHSQISVSSFPPHLALVETLGEGRQGPGYGHRVVADAVGHTGCVNTLDWDPSGRLASAGDDTKICIWKAGLGSTSTAHTGSRLAPTLRLGLSDTIDTGHRANIFSLKWAPTSDSKLFSCAGDGQVRVFDLAASTTSDTVSSEVYSSSWNHHARSSGACIKVYTCHDDRVKKIATENSDMVFLTASEDGTVRQHDLRSPHSCSPTVACPPPLLSYPSLPLYALSISKQRPYMFVVAGRSPFAYLHDRRMIRDSVLKDWNVDLDRPGSASESPTHCVRRFGVPKPDGSGYITNHVVSAKLGQLDPTELLLSYSGDGIYLFNTDSDVSSLVNPVPAPAVDTPSSAARRRNPSPVNHSPHAPIVSPLRTYCGHRNTDTVKDVNFLFGESCVASGSDDGNLFIFDKKTSTMKGIFAGDSSVVNVMQMHPTLPVVAVSGIDSTIKIFAPASQLVAESGREEGSSGTALDGQQGAISVDLPRNRIDEQEAIVQRNRDYRDDSSANIGDLDTQAIFALLASRINRNAPLGAPPTSLEIVGDEEGETRVLVDGEEIDDCVVM